MKLVDTTCPSCGARLTYDLDKGRAFCQYCGTELLVDDEIQRVRYDNAEEAGYLFERGRQRAMAEIAATPSQKPDGFKTVDCIDLSTHEAQPAALQSPSISQTPPKRRKTFLWILGWIFFFPLPLAVIIMKRHETDPNVEINTTYVLKALAWVLGWFYLFPVPLTILALRDKEFSRPKRIATIVAGWLAYLFIISVTRSRS